MKSSVLLDVAVCCDTLACSMKPRPVKANPVKTVEVRLYLSEEDIRRANELHSRMGAQFTRNKSISAVLSSALQSMEEAGWTMTLPLRFIVKHDPKKLAESDTSVDTRYWPKVKN